MGESDQSQGDSCGRQQSEVPTSILVLRCNALEELEKTVPISTSQQFADLFSSLGIHTESRLLIWQGFLVSALQPRNTGGSLIEFSLEPDRPFEADVDSGCAAEKSCESHGL